MISALSVEPVNEITRGTEGCDKGLADFAAGANDDAEEACRQTSLLKFFREEPPP